MKHTYLTLFINITAVSKSHEIILLINKTPYRNHKTKPLKNLKKIRNIFTLKKKNKTLEWLKTQIHIFIHISSDIIEQRLLFCGHGTPQAGDTGLAPQRWSTSDPSFIFMPLVVHWTFGVRELVTFAFCWWRWRI